MIVLQVVMVLIIIINILQGKENNYKGLYKISRIISKPLVVIAFLL